MAAVGLLEHVAAFGQFGICHSKPMKIRPSVVLLCLAALSLTLLLSWLSNRLAKTATITNSRGVVGSAGPASGGSRTTSAPGTTSPSSLSSLPKTNAATPSRLPGALQKQRVLGTYN